MGLDPLEKSWGSRHPYIKTVLLIVLIVLAGFFLRYLQQKYLPAEEREYIVPVYINESFEDINQYFSTLSNLTLEEQDVIFDERYRYNVFTWTCRPLGCQKIVGKDTLKLICSDSGYTEDVRVAMQEGCEDAALQPSVTVTFQLMSKTTGEYYLGRAGEIVDE